MTTKKAMSHSRSRRKLEEATRKYHAGLIQWFYDHVEYDAEIHDWSYETEQRATHLKRQWTAYATKHNFSTRLTRSLSAALKLIKVDLILASKYDATAADRGLVIGMLEKNHRLTPEDICIEILKSNQHGVA